MTHSTVNWNSTKNNSAWSNIQEIQSISFGASPYNVCTDQICRLPLPTVFLYDQRLLTSETWCGYEYRQYSSDKHKRTKMKSKEREREIESMCKMFNRKKRPTSFSRTRTQGPQTPGKDAQSECTAQSTGVIKMRFGVIPGWGTCATASFTKCRSTVTRLEKKRRRKRELNVENGLNRLENPARTCTSCHLLWLKG
jgi:hypothetical protein